MKDKDDNPFPSSISLSPSQPSLTPHHHLTTFKIQIQWNSRNPRRENRKNSERAEHSARTWTDMATLQKFNLLATQCGVAPSLMRSPRTSPVVQLSRRKATLRMLLSRRSPRRGDLLAQPVIPRNSTPQKEEKDSVAAQGYQTLNDRAFAAARRHESEECWLTWERQFEWSIK
jgi:hypothetical protein